MNENNEIDINTNSKNERLVNNNENQENNINNIKNNIKNTENILKINHSVNNNNNQENENDEELEENLYGVYINSPGNNDPEEINTINTSRYTWYNFIPKMLIEQFNRLANSYFLIIAVLQCVKELSYSGGTPLMLIPLFFVVIINGVKDLYEDYKKKKSDKEENNSKTLVYDVQAKTFIEKKWSEVVLGDIIKVLENKSFPADLLMLTSSEQNGMCYVETKNIDGETNLKFKQSNENIKNMIQNENDLCKFKYVCVTKQPDEFIYKFDGTLYKIDDQANVKLNEDHILVDKKSFLLRGCILRQTEYIIGTAIYLGPHTKSMMNSPSAKSKHSTVESIMNKMIVLVFSFQIILSLISAFIHLICYYVNFKELDYYVYRTDLGNKKENWFVLFNKMAGTWILICSNFVPISLLVTMETIKFFQAWVIEWDIDMFDKSRGNGCLVQTSTLNEELGQIKYVFTDKTGTLTKNYMQYKMMSIGNDQFGCMESNKDREEKFKDKYGKVPNVDFIDKDNKLEDAMKDPLKINLINDFMLCLSLCNTVIIDTKNYEKTGKIDYQASSPDEKALLCFARTQGYIFTDRAIDNTMTLEIKGQNQKYKILNTLEYSSERKRMSVICRTPDNKLIMYSKGADSMIESLLNTESKHSEMLTKTNLFLKDFAKKGLRTLMIAYKELEENVYKNWNDRFEKVLMDINHTEEDINQLYDEMEVNLRLIGSTAIEDQLQDNVDDIIKSMMETGMKVWMLTGDKLDTAKNIAISCKLFQSHMIIIEIIEHQTEDQLREQLLSVLKNDEFYDKNITYGLLVASEELQKIFANEGILKLFHSICINCLSVVCCRVSPKQKAQVVNLIKITDNAITMAIGDGANDVGMITEANVGIGIQGIEGTQAARASDYVISQFSYMKKLLFFHGREYYRRNSWVICYNFYKNGLFVSPMFWAGVFNLYSGVTLYDPWIHQLYNVVFTALPCGYYGIYSLEYPQEELVNNSFYYIQGIYNKCFHFKRLIKFEIFSFIEGLFIFFFAFYSYQYGNFDGSIDDFYAMGTAVYAGIIMVANLKVVYDTNYHEFWSTFIISISVLSYYVCVFLMSSDYILSKSVVIEFYILDNIRMVIFDIKFLFYILLICSFCYFIEVCGENYPVLFGLVIEGKYLKPYRTELPSREEYKKLALECSKNVILNNSELSTKDQTDKDLGRAEINMEEFKVNIEH